MYLVLLNVSVREVYLKQLALYSTDDEHSYDLETWCKLGLNPVQTNKKKTSKRIFLAPANKYFVPK